MSNRPVGVNSDPLTDVVARVLTVPLRDLYAVLWRTGIVEIADWPASDAAAAPR
ncbi:MAG TPA: Rv1535 domain-containing protein [Mycobacterium sp.]|nr:Rv1535 domain-containing protein [Mycobacterium sp.]